MAWRWPRSPSASPPQPVWTSFALLRVSELVTLRWRNLIDGVANVTGKAGKTRVVRFSRGTWDELAALRSAEAIGE